MIQGWCARVDVRIGIVACVIGIADQLLHSAIVEIIVEAGGEIAVELGTERTVGIDVSQLGFLPVDAQVIRRRRNRARRYVQDDIAEDLGIVPAKEAHQSLESLPAGGIPVVIAGGAVTDGAIFGLVRIGDAVDEPGIDQRFEILDGGLRYRLAESLNVSAGLFELRKPYFTLDAGDRFGPLGETRNRGAEFSLAGAVTPRLNVVAGVVVLEPRVTGIEDAQTPIGSRPVGLPARSAELNLDWRTPFEGLSLDAGISHDGAVPARVDNAVWIPARTIVNLGARYRFRIAGRDTTLRVQALNIGDVYGFALRGAGAYAPIAGRRVSAYLTIDL